MAMDAVNTQAEKLPSLGADLKEIIQQFSPDNHS
jgi:hypothetical protein